MNLNELQGDAAEERPSVVVRVSESYWADDRGMHYRKDFNILRRLSTQCNFFEEDLSNVGAYEVSGLIQNFEVGPGVYEIVFIPGQPEYLTGRVEEWTYELVALDEP